MRKLTILLALAAIGIVGIAAEVSKDKVSASKSVVNTDGQESEGRVANPPGVIDGAKTPDKIPDVVAYSLLFDLIAGRQTEAERNRIRSYLRQIGLGDEDSDALIAAAEEYRVRDGALGERADAIKSRNHPNHLPLTAEEREQLKRLQKQHESVVREIVTSLPRRLSKEGLSRVRLHVNERVK